jgi:hypothetical protein
VREATTLFDGFSEMIEPNPIEKGFQARRKSRMVAVQRTIAEELRRQVATRISW